jgi:DNA mismatch endonuclease (patch repair protein)
MAAQATSGTKPEMAVRRKLHSRGLRYRVNYRPEPSLRRSADIVFTRAKVAVFIDGWLLALLPRTWNIADG